MARKSRKITAAAEPVIEVQPTETFPTAIYARLSVENSGKSEKVDVIANQIEICKSYIADRPYEKYTSGSITKQEYLKQKSDTDAKLAENAEAIRFAEERMRELDSEQPCSDERLDAVCNEYRNSSALTYELAHAFISAVYVHNQDNIEIVWKFKDFLSETEAE